LWGRNKKIMSLAEKKNHGAANAAGFGWRNGG
jgi:hypothetical protein